MVLVAFGWKVLTHCQKIRKWFLHTHTLIIFTFALGVRHKSQNPITIFPAKDPEWPAGFPVRRRQPFRPSAWAQFCSCWFISNTREENWGRVYTILASCPSAQVFCLCCCHRIQWLLKWYKETTLLVVTVVSGSKRAILLLSHGQA